MTQENKGKQTLVTTAVRIAISIDRLMNKQMRLQADLSRLLKTMTNEECNEYKARIK